MSFLRVLAAKGYPKRRAGGLKGGKARAESLTPEQRRKIASTAAQARWHGFDGREWSNKPAIQTEALFSRFHRQCRP